MATRSELEHFIRFYGNRHSSREWSVMVTCACGYFHTYTKEAERMMKECADYGFIKKSKNTFEILIA